MSPIPSTRTVAAAGTFAPADSFPPVLRWIIEVTPLYQAVELLRDLTTGRVSWATLLHVLYLAALAAAGLTVASRRMAKLLTR